MVNRPNFKKAHLDQFWTWVVESVDSFGERLNALERVVDALAAHSAKMDQKTKPKSKPKKK